jgi:FlaA1/EpsC-like NDP-sugar epimerase
VLGVYAMVLAASFWFSYELIGNFGLSGADWQQFAGQLPVVGGLQLVCLLARRQCKGLLCYFRLPELWQVTMGLLQACVLLLGISLIPGSGLPAPNIIVADLCISLLLLSALRVLLRLWRERVEGEQTLTTGPRIRVGIIGAGSLGAQLAHCLNTYRNFGRTAVAFFDDDFAKWQKQIHQVPVVGMPECVLQGWDERLDEVAIALPNASASRLQQINELFEKTNLRVYNVQWPLPVSTPPQMAPAPSKP